MEMQVTAGIAVGTVVDFVRMEHLVDGIGSSGYIFKEQGALLGSQVHQLADVILISNDHTAGMALLLKQDQLAHLQIADLDAETGQDFAAHAITTILIFHNFSS